MANGLNYLYKSVSKLIFQKKNDRLIFTKDLEKFGITFLPSSPIFSGDVQSPGMASSGQGFSFFCICLEKSVCYFITKFKADPLLTLLPTHISTVPPNMGYVKTSGIKRGTQE